MIIRLFLILNTSGLWRADFWWARNPASCEYAIWHTVHLYGLSPVCNLVWLRNVEDWENDLSQYVQWKGFSCVWILMCERRLLRELKRRLQIWHFNRPLFSEEHSFIWSAEKRKMIFEVSIFSFNNIYIPPIDNCSLPLILYSLNLPSLHSPLPTLYHLSHSYPTSSSPSIFSCALRPYLRNVCVYDFVL